MDIWESVVRMVSALGVVLAAHGYPEDPRYAYILDDGTGLPPQRLTLSRPSLDDVFLQATGELIAARIVA